MADLYITTKSGLAFDDSFVAPGDGEYGLVFSFEPGRGFAVSPIQSGGAAPQGYAFLRLGPSSNTLRIGADSAAPRVLIFVGA